MQQINRLGMTLQFQKLFSCKVTKWIIIMDKQPSVDHRVTITNKDSTKKNKVRSSHCQKSYSNKFSDNSDGQLSEDEHTEVSDFFPKVSKTIVLVTSITNLLIHFSRSVDRAIWQVSS